MNCESNGRVNQIMKLRVKIPMEQTVPIRANIVCESNCNRASHVLRGSNGMNTSGIVKVNQKRHYESLMAWIKR